MTFIGFFFKQKTAYEMRISDWSSDVCSSDLKHAFRALVDVNDFRNAYAQQLGDINLQAARSVHAFLSSFDDHEIRNDRSEEHTSELQSLMRISYAVFCLKKKKKIS